MKIKAFTIMELMVGFVLTSIVITFAYFGMELISKNKVAIEQEQNLVKSQSSMYTVMTRDFFEANTISGESTDFRITFINQEINYLLEDTMIIRESIKNDTLYIGEYDKNIQYAFDREIESVNLIIDSMNYNFKKTYYLADKIRK